MDHQRGGHSIHRLPRSNYEEPFDLTALDALVVSVIRSHRFAGNVAFRARRSRARVDPTGQRARTGGESPARTPASTAPRRFTCEPANPQTKCNSSCATAVTESPRQTTAAALQPFIRLAEQDAPGSGLGLAIVARVARRHNGRVEMRNRADGFEVRVTLSARHA